MPWTGSKSGERSRGWNPTHDALAKSYTPCYWILCTLKKGHLSQICTKALCSLKAFMVRDPD